MSALRASPATRDGRTLLQAVPGPARSPEAARRVRTRAEKRSLGLFVTPSTDSEAAYDDLNHRLLLARERGEQVPCLGPESEAWTSEDADDQEHAADRCYDCPALFLCKQYADLADELVGTWGGETRNPARRQSPAVTARAARSQPAGGRGCSCGCGEWTKGGRYLPGHDSRHLARLVRYVRAGAVSADGALRALAESPGLQAKLRSQMK